MGQFSRFNLRRTVGQWNRMSRRLSRTVGSFPCLEYSHTFRTEKPNRGASSSAVMSLSATGLTTTLHGLSAPLFSPFALLRFPGLGRVGSELARPTGSFLIWWSYMAETIAFCFFPGQAGAFLVCASFIGSPCWQEP